MSDATEIVMYASPLCGFCAAAKRLLKKKGVEYTEISTLFDRERRDEMIARTGRRTVPQIFIGERHIGGYDELHALNVRGELDPLLASVRRSGTP
jgi:glutaredoxin 3